MKRQIEIGQDPVVELYKKDVDRTLLRENLKLTHQQRLDKAQRMLDLVLEVRRAGAANRARKAAEKAETDAQDLGIPGRTRSSA